VRVIDVSALAPGPFATMLLADFGADVIAIEPVRDPEFDVAGFFNRGKRSVLVDLRQPDGVDLVTRLTDRADVFVEGSRPGSMERLGLGPDVLCARNAALVYTRLTGWGQDGPYADRAGHDINFLAIAGALGAIGGDAPVPPLNLVGDFASGSLMAALGTLLALFERQRSGRGQVVDSAIVDGAALLLSAQLGEFNTGRWGGRRHSLLGGSAPFYSVYRCADDRWLAVGAIEAKFYGRFLDRAGVDADPDGQFQLDEWAALHDKLAERFLAEPRQHWLDLFADADCCTTPVLEIEDLEDDVHLAQRRTVVRRDGWLQAAPAPRLGASPGAIGARPPVRGAHTAEVLEEAGFSPTEIGRLFDAGVIAGGR